ARRLPWSSPTADTRPTAARARTRRRAGCSRAGPGLWRAIRSDPRRGGPRPFALVLEDVDEPDEVRALEVEALPAAAADRSLAVAIEVFLAAVQEDVVLAGQVEDALGLQPLEDLGDGFE